MRVKSARSRASICYHDETADCFVRASTHTKEEDLSQPGYAPSVRTSLNETCCCSCIVVAVAVVRKFPSSASRKDAACRKRKGDQFTLEILQTLNQLWPNRPTSRTDTSIQLRHHLTQVRIQHLVWQCRERGGNDL